MRRYSLARVSRRCAAALLATLSAAPLMAATPAATGSIPAVLVTGANRGIGLEFVRQYAGLGWRVIATCRDPVAARELAALATAHPKVSVEPLDIANDASVRAAAERHRGEPLELLVNNAALLGPRDRQQFGAFDFSLFDESFAVNATGPMRVTQAFIDNVAKGGRRILILSSAAGSVAMTSAPANLYAYRASKAALNLLAKNLALELKPRGIVVALVNPGLVDTRGLLALKPEDKVPDEFAPLMPMIRSGAIKLITPTESVKAMIGLVAGLPPDKSGVFLNYDGTALPW